MRSLFSLSLITCIIALLFASVIKFGVLESIICAMLFLLTCFSRKDENSQLLTLIFAAVFVLEVCVAIGSRYFIFPAVESFFVENIYAFGLQLLVNLLLLFLVKHRMTIAVLLTRGKSASVFEKNYAEGPLYFLVMVLVFIDFMALMENFLRNLDRMGVNEETAKIFWEVTFFYDYFEYLKAVPTFLCITLLYVGLVVRTKRQPIQN
ncbi:MULTISPECIES: hypothetical protein [Pseudoalteromonas]|uniref:Uncharacterized protein n=1 Tax=Pseudoalteromonas piscicida TaxID=43662 RepID=A0A2A5JUL3_PSEO7|nr:MULTISPECIES: hypothetical protein [Pseudoalteromonas]PCK33019.1 hypothetical protein CEX98_04045 [Pseudoalteromonas piscicida]QUI68798.1 hypothetical protein GSF13_03045 [Pseudoalteromonas sp. M8]